VQEGRHEDEGGKTGVAGDSGRQGRADHLDQKIGIEKQNWKKVAGALGAGVLGRIGMRVLGKRVGIRTCKGTKATNMVKEFSTRAKGKTAKGKLEKTGSELVTDPGKKRERLPYRRTHDWEKKKGCELTPLNCSRAGRA